MQTISHFFKLTKAELKLWFSAFVALCLCFIPFFFNFIWGNHDWMPLISDNPLYGGLIEGRYSQYILLNLLLMGKILPILNILLGFLLYTLALTLLNTRFFKFSNHKLSVLFLIAAATLPYMTEILYFQFIVFSQLSWTLVITLSLLAAQKSLSSPHFIIYMLLSAILLGLTVGGYPASINLFTTAGILWIIKEAKQDLSLKKFLHICLPYVISIIIALSSLYFVYNWLQNHHLMMKLYNTQAASLNTLLPKIFPTISISIKSIIQPLPFLGLSLKLIIVLIFALFIKKSLSAYIKYQKIVCLGLLCLLLVALKFSTWLINENPEEFFSINDPAGFMIRADFYAIPCFILFALNTICINAPKLTKNLTYILALFLIFTNLNNNLSFTKTSLLGFKAETLLQNRINQRIQENSSYNPDLYYTIVQTGDLPLRERYYKKQPLEKYGYYTLKTAYSRFWIPAEYYNFYEPIDFVQGGGAVPPKDITPEMIDFVKYKVSRWPSPNAIYLDNKYGIVVLTPQGKNMLTKQFQQIESSNK